MPKRVYQNPGVLETITRPVVKDIAAQILQMTGLPTDLQIQYPGDSGVVAQPGSGINPNAAFTTFDSKAQFLIVLEEKPQHDRILSTAVFYPDAPMIFSDDECSTYCRQVYSPTDFVLNITYRATDRDMAIRWRNDIRTRISMNREVMDHQISYSYVFDDMVIETLKEIHAMQEAVAPYGRDFDTYLKTFFNSRVRQLSTQAGTEERWGVAETQGRVAGYFEFEGEPEDGGKVDGNAAWTISFSYVIKFDKPVATVMDYPLVVHNQLIDARYRETSRPARPEDHQITYSLSSAAFAHFEISRFSQNNGLPGLAVPDFDEFMPRTGSVPYPTVRVATMLVQIDTTNPRLLLDMKTDVGDYQLDPIIQNFMIGEGQYLAVVGASVLNVSVYCGTLLMHPAQYTINNKLQVTLTNDPDLRQVYHVRLGMHCYPSRLPAVARTRLRNDCRAAFKLLTALCPGLITDQVLTTCNANNTVPLIDFQNALDYIDRRTAYKDWLSNVQFNTVMTYSITAKRRN